MSALSVLSAAGTLSSNILKISQHEGAELFDGPPVAGRAREAYPQPADELQTHFSRTIKGLTEFYGKVAIGGIG
jgi:hypothetical protein